MKSKTGPKAPGHLSDSSAAFWQRVVGEYDIKDDAGLKLLTLAAECLDTAETARAAIAANGQTYTDRFGAPRPRPEVAIQRNAMQTFSRLVRTLDLEIEGAK